MRALPLLLLVLGGCATGSGQDPGSPDAQDPPVDAPPEPIDALGPDAEEPDEPDAMESSCTPPAAGAIVDTCAQAQDLGSCVLEPAGVTVTGDTTGYVDNVQPASSCTDFLPDGPDAVYLVSATAGQTITATVTPTGWDTSIYIIQACSMTPTCLIGDDASASDGAETVSYPVTTGGTYHVVVDGWNAGVQGPYSLTVRVQ